MKTAFWAWSLYSNLKNNSKERKKDCDLYFSRREVELNPGPSKQNYYEANDITITLWSLIMTLKNIILKRPRNSKIWNWGCQVAICRSTSELPCFGKYLSYLRLICSDSLAWFKYGNHVYIKQTRYRTHSACNFLLAGACCAFRPENACLRMHLHGWNQ